MSNQFNDNTGTALLEKRVRFSISKDKNEEGIVLSLEMLPESAGKPPTSHYAIVLVTGEIKHVAAWRINGLVSGVKYNMLPILSRQPKPAPPVEEPAEVSSGSDDLPF